MYSTSDDRYLVVNAIPIAYLHTKSWMVPRLIKAKPCLSFRRAGLGVERAWCLLMGKMKLKSPMTADDNQFQLLLNFLPVGSPAGTKS